MFMNISTFLSSVAQAQGADTLRGAIVFVRLQRAIDDVIAAALALGPYHRGSPGPYSHCFLVGADFSGAATPILDCTIRGSRGEVVWDLSLPETLDILARGMGPRGAGGVYAARLGDYDDARVTACGVKWIPNLSVTKRQGVLDAATGLNKNQPVRYDLPGLVRELVRLLTGATLPPTPDRLFCSAFAQASYRTGLGPAGDFASSLAPADVTPDDIWYSTLGARLAASPSATPGTTVSALIAAPPATSAASATPSVSAANASVATEIERAIAIVVATPGLIDSDHVLAVLKGGRDQLARASADPMGRSDAALHSDEMFLSIIQSAMQAGPPTTAGGALTGKDIIGFKQYADLDPRWLATVWNRITAGRVAFVPAPDDPEDIITDIPDNTLIALAGDWGTGNAASLLVAQHIKAQGAAYTIHLGDVYYSGTPEEEQSRLVQMWPPGTTASFALNSNHEMYSGGHGYFGVALQASLFQAQEGRSFFGLSNANWLILGLDSAYAADGVMYQTGALHKNEIDWIAMIMGSAHAKDARGNPKKVVVLTHHQPIEYNGTLVEPLYSSMITAIGRAPDYWYWGHVHGVAAFKPMTVDGSVMRCRCVGHGGVPYEPDPLTPVLSWTESGLANDSEQPTRALNGYAVLRFTGDAMVEEFYSERGELRASSQPPRTSVATID
jgi:hypothetical protein